MMIGFFWTNSMPSPVCWGGPNDWQIIHQQEDCSERCWLYAWIWGNCICTMLLLVCHLEAPMYRHDLLAEFQWLLEAKLNLQRSVFSYIVNFMLFQRCVTLINQDRYCKISQKFISFMHLYIFMNHDIELTVDVVGWHRMAPLWMPLIAHLQVTMQNIVEVPLLHG